MGSHISQRSVRPRSVRLLRSVRFKIVLLLFIPFIALSALWAFAAGITLGDGLNLLHVKTIQEHLGYPSGALGSALQQERRLSLVYLGGKDAGSRATMESQRLVSDQQADLFRRLAADQGAQDVADPETKQWTAEVLQRLGTLRNIRRAVDSGSVERPQTYTTYTQVIASINGLQGSLATLRDPGAAKDVRTQVALSRAREVLSQEDALLSGVLAAKSLTPGEQADLIKLVGTQRFLYAQAVVDLNAADQAYYRKITSSPEFGRFQALEDFFVSGPPGANAPTAVTGVEWKTTAGSITTRLRGLELSSTAGAEQRSKPIANGIILRVVLAGALGLTAVVAMVALSIWVARSVIRELTGLKRTALELANERLPSVIRRLRRGDKVDAAAEAPPLSFGTDEIDQVGQAFNAARHTAIQGAIEEATLRRGISEVFVNLARRNQALLHRQLNLLDTMERRVSEPDELEDLFRLDHLAARMRRHAEGLIILSGQEPGRGWRNPVPVVDVVRAAAAEVEDYARVTVLPIPQVAVSGQTVVDLIHLLAELIENATLFSPPYTTVQVSAQLVAHGFAVEIEDRGLSMCQADLTAANDRLANPPEFDLSNSAQLGLFVVGRLAERHGIKVTLRTSPYGGTTAIVLVPESVIARGVGPARDIGELALTRRAEDALIPVGAIGNGNAVESPGGQPSASGSEDRPLSRVVPPGPGPQPRPDRAPLPQRAPSWTAQPPPPPTTTPHAAPVPGGGRPELPHRVRQASLAPQLRDESMPLEESSDGRSPEELRTMLNSIQKGWLRGRSEAGQVTGSQLGPDGTPVWSHDKEER